MKKISQAEARRFKQRVAELERQNERRFAAYCHDYPGGVNLRQWAADQTTIQVLKTARRLQHAVVCTLSSDETKVYFYAVPK